MKPIAAPIPHHALAQAFAAVNHQHRIALPRPSSAAEAGAPVAMAPIGHPRGHLWAGASVYHAPALGMTHHIAAGDMHGLFVSQHVAQGDFHGIAPSGAHIAIGDKNLAPQGRNVRGSK